MTKTVKLNRFCAVVALLVVCVLFASRTIRLYEEKFNQIKADIESHYAIPPKEAYLKQRFWDYLKITGRKYVNGNIIMNDERLVQERNQNPPLLEERAEVIIQLNDYLQNKNTPFLFLRAPDPMRDNADMPRGYENTVVEDGLRFLSLLEESGVDYIDFRVEMTNDYDTFAQTFYWGDHHWNVDGAMWAYGKLGTVMNSKYGFHLDSKTWDLQEYERITFNKTFIGSTSNQVSKEKEDIDVLIPKFRTDFEISDKQLEADAEQKILASGEFIDVFTPDAKNKNNTSFSYRSLNVYGKGAIKQHINQAAQERKKVLLIADSFSYPFVTYLSTAIKHVDYLYIDSVENKKLYPMLENESYGLVLFLAFDGCILADGDDIKEDRMYLGEPL